ncbi:AMP-binding protein [Achromobacter deleyi]|uniref:AMP-binding protein n=1 Tax=Achromobacter deleyi TaxID=1353891 RepID=UPI001492CBF6|nr:AMP-binding protein [Achromobacter deleyi]QVQ28937.1 AMP-binding protein [Achromobacter deleyi]UIP19053.1 AMP-binding protein [Achromobacter deleyi]
MTLPYSTFSEHLDVLSARQPDAVALIDQDQRISVADLRAQSRALAAGLARIGVRPGHRVAVWLPNCAAWVESFLACAHLGALVLAVNTRFRALEVADILGRGQADWLVFWPGFKGIDFQGILDGVAPEHLARLQGVVALSATGEPAASPRHGKPVHQYADLLACADPAPPAQGNAGVLCFTTSGTTSKPKFVLHDQQTLLRHGVAVAQAYGYDDRSCILASAPFCGAFGFATLVGGLARGAPVVCAPVFNAAQSADAIARHAVTHTYANNEALVGMMQAAPPANFASARLFGFASFTPALDNMLDLAREAGVPLTGLYGSSELIALVAGQPRDPAEGDVSARHQPGGTLIYPEARVRARDPETGQVLPHGQSGEIEILSPSLMLGYLDNPDATRGAVTGDGYFKTGDLGYTLTPRQFVFQTRMGDSLRLSGFLVNPVEIEQVVETLPGVRACQVVGATSKGKIVPYAFVLLHPGASADPAGWTAACKAAMAGFKVPAGFTVLDAFPSVESANSVKIQKHRLREMADAMLSDSSS